MDVLEAIRNGSATIVIFDDLFAGPGSLAHIPAQSRNALFDRLEDDGVAKAALQAALGVESDDDRELVELATLRARELWLLYDQDPDKNDFLSPLFESLSAERAEIHRLNSLVEHLEREFGRRPQTFSSLADGRPALKDCAIAFVDVYMGNVQTITQVLELHKGFSEEYRSGYCHEDGVWPKLVVLMSTRLPEAAYLRSFREGAGIRSAFFRPIDKYKLTPAAVDSMLVSWRKNYGAAASLDRYLTELSDIVRKSADQVVAELDRLEIHDLAMLDAARLVAEGEPLHSYASWLTSEALAARARQNAADAVERSPVRAEGGPVDTRLVQGSVLFDLFAEITSTPNQSGGHPQFGEIFAPRAGLGKQSQTVFIAVSSACDLVRCPADYEVLLLQGTMAPAGRSAAELLQLEGLFGQTKHLMRYRHEDEEKWGLISWNVGALLTRPARLLADKSEFVRLGRMSELFAHEVKHFAMSHASRIGLPVVPTVVRAASVRVKGQFNFGRDEAPLVIDEIAPDALEVPALITKGRLASGASPAQIIQFTAQFREWFLEQVVPKLKAASNPGRTEALVASLKAWNDWRVSLDKGKGKPDGVDLTVRLIEQEPPGVQKLEIWVAGTDTQ